MFVFVSRVVVGMSGKKGVKHLLGMVVEDPQPGSMLVG